MSRWCGMMSRRATRFLWLAGWLALGAGWGVRACAGVYEDACELYRRFPIRCVGFPGNREAAAFVAERLATRCAQTGTVRFRHPVLTPGTAELIVSGERIEIFPLQPNGVDPGNLEGEEWQGSLVYAGRGLPADLKGRPLVGVAAVMEFNSERNWLTVVQTGADVLLFLEPEDTTSYQAATKAVAAPLSIPRFLVPRAQADRLRERVRDRTVEGATVRAQRRRWVNETLTDHWGIVPGTSRADEVVHLQVALDSSSVCRGLPGGAESAANLAIFLRLLERISAEPVARTVVFSAVNAYRTGMAGPRHYTWSAFAPEDVLSEEEEELRSALAIEQYILEAYRQPLSAEHVEFLREAKQNAGGKSVELRKRIQEVLTTHLNEGRQEIAHLQQEVKGGGLSPEDAAGISEREARIRADGKVLVKLMSLFNKFGKRARFGPADGGGDADGVVTASDRQVLEGFLAEAIRRSEGAESSILTDLAENEANRSLRTALGDKQTALYLFIDCSFHHDKAGFFNQSYMQMRDYPELMKAVVKFSRDSLELAAAVSAEAGVPNCLEDTVLNNAGIPWQNHLADMVATPTLFGNQALVPSVCLATVRDARRYRFTTLDDPQHMPAANVERLGAFVEHYLPALLERGALGRGYPITGRNHLCMLRVLVRQVDAFSLTVPKVPVAEALVVTRPQFILSGGAWESMRGDVNLDQMVMSDARGSAVLRQLRRTATYFSEAFGFDTDGEVTHALDLGRMETRFSSDLWTPGAVFERIVALFRCRKYDLVGLIEPLTFEPVTSIDVIDAFQESTPLSFGLSGVGPHPGATKKRLHTVVGNVACIFAEETLPFKLRLGKGLLLNSSEDEPIGSGYNRDEVPTDALRLAMARDTWTLDEDRLSKLESKGVNNAMASKLHKRAGELLDEAEQLRTQGRMQEFLNRATEALGVEYRAYPSILSTSNDMIKGIVIFLGLVIPFSFFVMKLTCSYTEVNKQLAWFVGVFFSTVLFLRVVHPVFELAHAPTIVVVAFVTLGLALFVSWIVYARFDDEMGKVLNQFTDADSSEAPRSRLAGVAFAVGVNNMKRRRVRTGLTCATVVLVTFTMLSFTSVTEHTKPARARLRGAAPYDGFLYANPGFAPLNDSVVQCLRALFEEKGQVVSRVWAQRLNQYGGYMPYSLDAPASGQVLESKVILGLEVAEDGFVAAMPLAAGRWLSADDAAELVLSVKAASFVGITPDTLEGSYLVLDGKRLPVVGLLDDERLAAMRDVADVPILPLEQTATLAAAQKQAQNQQEGLTQSATGDPVAGSSPLRPQDVVITSPGFARRLGGASYRALVVKHADAATTWEEAHRVVRYASNRLILTLTDGVPLGRGSATLPAGAYGLLPSVGKQIGGLATIIVPLIIGATIILNTMLGAVMERRREISIYNAIGLNPTHVAVFFFAESLVFGLVGAVAGYLVGQALSKLIVMAGIMTDVNMNYSSLTVVMVIFLTILTVLLSTVYPAIMATRAAVPSGKRKWSLPVPEGDEMVVDFPFSYDEQRVLAVLGYLHSYFELNSEASSGRFVADPVALGRVPERDATSGRDVWAMIHDVSLAPFDLGVNQRTEVYAYFDPKVGAYRIAMHLIRRAGEESNWKTANKPFLEGLRKHLLRWRSQNQTSQERYFQEGLELFREAPTLA